MVGPGRDHLRAIATSKDIRSVIPPICFCSKNGHTARNAWPAVTLDQPAMVGQLNVMAYTLRRTWPEDHGRQDYVFRCDGVDVGRCYLRSLAGNVSAWHWTVYIGHYVRRTVEGIPIAGDAGTLDEAKTAFHKSFNGMIAARVVQIP